MLGAQEDELQAIAEALREGARLREHLAEQWPEAIAKAARIIVESLRAGGKVLACGNGGSAADALHFAGELVNRFEREREGLAAVALVADASVLTSIGNDMGFEKVFARQVQALGRAGDVLVAISSSGMSANVIAAVDAAAEQNMAVVALTGKDGGRLAAHPAVRVLLHVPHASTPRVQEMHITALHLICAEVDRLWTGGG